MTILPEDIEKQKFILRAVGDEVHNGWKPFTQLLEKIHPTPSPERAFDEEEDKHSFGPDVLATYKENIDTVTSARATLFHKLLLWALSEVKGIPRSRYNTIANTDALEYFDPKMDEDHMEEFLSPLFHRGIEIGDLTYDDIERITPLATKLARLSEIYIPDEKTLKLIGDELEKTGNLEQVLEKHPNKDKFYKVAEEIKQEFWKLQGDEIERRLKRMKEKSSAGTSTTKIIIEKEPALEDITIESLKNMGVDLKLEKGNVPERKSKIFSWLVQNGMIIVKEEKGKPVVKATEKLHTLAGKHGGKVAAAIIKWAAEERMGLEDVKPVAGIISALEEVRQKAKNENPELAKTLEKALSSKHAITELRLTLAGEMTLKELSERWERYGFSLLDLLKKDGALKNAFRVAVEEFRKAGFGVLPVPRETLPLIENPELETVTAARLFYSALESVAVRGLPERGEEIIELVTRILERVPASSPYVEEIPKELERSAEALAKTLALMKDGSYLEVLEAELAPLLEKVPETRKVGLFKRESPRRKVEDFATLLMEGNLDEDDAERKAGELKEYLKGYLASEEVEKLIAGMMLPFRARKLLEKHGTAEGFLSEYAHSMASRMLSLEGTLAGGEMPDRDELVRLFAFIPSVDGPLQTPLKKFKENTALLRVGRQN